MLKLKTLFSSGNLRSQKLKRNILSAFVLKGASIPVSYLMVPLTLHYLDITRYGIWITMSSLITWLHFFDIGLGNGLRNRLSEALAMNNLVLARKYVSTTYAILFIIMTVVFFLLMIINPFLDWTKILNTDETLGNELSLLALIVIGSFCIQFVLNLLFTVFISHQTPSITYLIRFVLSVFSLITVYLLTIFTIGSLISLAVVLSTLPILFVLLFSVLFYKGRFKEIAPSFKFIDFSLSKDLFSLGAKFFIINIAYLVLYQTSVILVAQFFGPKEVTPYNIAFKYFSVISMMFAMLVSPFWSAATEAFIHNDVLWLKRMMNKLISIWVIGIIFGFLLLIFMNTVVKFWIGQTVQISYVLGLTLLLYVIMNAWNGIYSNFLNGIGKIKLQLYLAIIGAVINVPISILLIRVFHMGINGIVLASSISVSATAILGPIQLKKLVNNSATGIWNK